MTPTSATFIREISQAALATYFGGDRPTTRTYTGLKGCMCGCKGTWKDVPEGRADKDARVARAHAIISALAAMDPKAETAPLITFRGRLYEVTWVELEDYATGRGVIIEYRAHDENSRVLYITTAKD